MRRLLHTFFALAVFLAAGGSTGTFAQGCARLSLGACGDTCGVDDTASPACCCETMTSETAQARVFNEPCASHTRQCGTSTMASIQPGLVKEQEAQAQGSFQRANGLEPKPWPLSLCALGWPKAGEAEGLSGTASLDSSLRSWAEAGRPGESTLDRLSRLSVFRI